ncbi:MAG: molecular chaperone DnaK, partial [Dehalococcoidia bacterium]|nr:molecular chaperone DnaK [Dehalococcoidia bacterium]
FDLGGGTFDITILQMGDGVFEVKSTNGDTFLGGDDFDQTILEWMIDEFKQETGIDLASDRMALQRLRDAAERAKVELSSVLETEINLPFITADASGPQHMVKTLSRAKLDQLVATLVDRTEGPCRQALTDSGLSADAIDEVIMVGGMSRMPAIQEKVKQVFGKEPNRNVNPDEAVAMGAAIQAGVLAGDVDDIVLLDVTPLTLGLETLGSVMTTLISRNTTIPTKKNETFTTAAENQTTVDIHVLQGERSMAADNKSIGRFMLDGLLPAPRGVPQIEVTFDIDANGILSVSAQDKGTGKEQKIVIQSGSGLEKEDIERMVDEAAQNEEADQVRRAEVETRNQADSLVFSSEKLLADNADKVPEELKTEVQGKIDAVKAAIASNNTVDMQTATTELNAALQKMGEVVYSQGAGTEDGGQGPGDGSATGGQEGDPASSDDDEGTVEGEFREV